MGELTGGSSPTTLAQGDTNHKFNSDPNTVDSMSTGVDGADADAFINVGSEKFPVYDVSKQEFLQNMDNGRKRLRFEQDSKPQKYMQNGKHNREFYVRYTDNSGKKYTRRIK